MKKGKISSLTISSIANDWVGGHRERHCRAALASLDFFVSFFYQEKNESLAGEAKNDLKNNYQNITKKSKFEMHHITFNY